MNFDLKKRAVPDWAKKAIRSLLLSTPASKKRIAGHQKQLSERHKRTKDLVNKIYGKNQITILGGPFQGIKYLATSNGSQLLPKLVGSYEEPIHRWVVEILENGKYSTILDVGCAEGYYAIGFAQAKSRPELFAFDVDNQALENARNLADLNSVSSVINFGDRFEGSMVTNMLAADSSRKILIFMDVEGAELDLLNTRANPVLLNCDVLVELHDCFYLGLTEKIINYFSETHKIEIIVDYPWRENDYGLDKVVSSVDERACLVDERRPKNMRWMFAKRK